MPRIPLFPDAGFSPEQRAVYDKMVAGPRGVVVGPMRAALHSPELADRWQSIGEFLRYRSSLPPRLSELAIVVCGRYWNSVVEWFIHSDLAERSGVATAILEDIRSARAPRFELADEYLVYEFTRRLLHSGQVDDATYAAAQDALGVVGLVELAALVGYYTMVAMTLNVHQIPAPSTDGRPLQTLDAAPQSDHGPTLLAAAARAVQAVGA